VDSPRVTWTSVSTSTSKAGHPERSTPLLDEQSQLCALVTLISFFHEGPSLAAGAVSCGGRWCPAGDRFESLHAAGFAWMPGPGSVDLDASRDELHVRRLWVDDRDRGDTVPGRGRCPHPAVQEAIAPAVRWTRGRVNAAPLGCSRCCPRVLGNDWVCVHARRNGSGQKPGSCRQLRRQLQATSPVEPAGIEPATSCLQSRRSPN
jgi:hypothetical protein